MAGETGTGRDALGDKAREEFFSEAQELVDGLSRDLLALDEVAKRGERPIRSSINDVFRAVHTLKGLSGLFGATPMAGSRTSSRTCSTTCASGASSSTPPVLDLLFQAVELYGAHPRERQRRRGRAASRR